MITAIILIFIVFVLWRTFIRFRRDDITGREFIMWSFLWTVIAMAVMVPERTDLIAQFLGVERGADLFVYVSIIFVFFVLFKIMVRFERTDRRITEINRAVALKEGDKEITKAHHEQ